MGNKFCPKGNQRMNWWLPPNAAILASSRQSELGLCCVNAEMLSSESGSIFYQRSLLKETNNNLTIQGAALFQLQTVLHTQTSILKPASLGNHFHYLDIRKDNFNSSMLGGKRGVGSALVRPCTLLVTLAVQCPLFSGNPSAPLSVQSFFKVYADLRIRTSIEVMHVGQPGLKLINIVPLSRVWDCNHCARNAFSVKGKESLLTRKTFQPSPQIHRPSSFLVSYFFCWKLLVVRHIGYIHIFLLRFCCYCYTWSQDPVS